MPREAQAQRLIMGIGEWLQRSYDVWVICDVF